MLINTDTKKAPVLILDEATSALDINTETRLLQSIKNIKTPIACLIITHRTSVLEICNRVFRMQQGGLQEIGKTGLHRNISDIISKDEKVAG
jgi:ATP-binding cassette subfamily C protein